MRLYAFASARGTKPGPDGVIAGPFAVDHRPRAVREGWVALPTPGGRPLPGGRASLVFAGTAGST